MEKRKDTFDEYLAVEAVSSTQLKRFSKSPSTYKWYEDNPQERTVDLHLGAAIHMAIIEPKEFKKRYVFEPPIFNKRRKEDKAKFEAYMLDCEKKGVLNLTPSQGELLKIVLDRVDKNGFIKSLFADNEGEVSYYWDDPQTGLKCKKRVDLDLVDFDAALDIKTYAGGGIEKFKYDTFKFGTDIQTAHYTQCVHKDFYLLAVEKKEPFSLDLMLVGTEYLERAKEKHRMLLNMLAWCKENDVWVGYAAFKILKEWYDGDSPRESLDYGYERVQEDKEIIILE